MKKILLAVMACSLLSACDRAPEQHHLICNDATHTQSFIVDITHFPDYIFSQGKRLYPDPNTPVISPGTSATLYQFSREKNVEDEYVRTSITLSRPEADKITTAIELIRENHFRLAWRALRGKFIYAVYEFSDTAGLQVIDSSTLSGDCKEFE
ncbi:hypothetical protein [Klebsiella variicola]|uniref:hypothetical protein n=1 Tax=Klebsiella variicola TaxID=244366 RepID=UPI003D08EE73